MLRDRSHFEVCGRLMLGSGTDTYDPTCELWSGHGGPCLSSGAIDQHRLEARVCVWCEETVKIRKDGRLAVHKWDVRQGGDEPVMANCIGCGTSIADAVEAMA